MNTVTNLEVVSPSHCRIRRFEEIKEIYRDKLWHEFFQTRDLSDKIVVTSGEGIGKTSTILPLLSREAQDDALNHNDNIQRFSAVSISIP